MGGGVNQLQIDALILEPSDALDKTFPICIKPFLVGFKGKEVVRIRVRHVYDLDYR